MRKIPVSLPCMGAEEEAAAVEALRSGWIAQGPRVAAFEREVAAHECVAHGVATSSCTTALHLALVACGVGPGMDVIVPSFTFVATANTVVEAGAVPVLVDVHRDTFCIDAEGVREVIRDQYEARDGRLAHRETGNVLWGILPVHQFGLCCDIHAINRIAAEYGLRVLEDAACALGARIGDTHEGAFGNVSCLSFHPRKSISTGEGGMVLCDDGALAEKLRALRSHGVSISADQRHAGKGFLLPSIDYAGYNYRMTDIQGAIGLAQVRKLDGFLQKKQEQAALYHRLLPAKVPELIPPTTPAGYFHSYQSYVCMLDVDALGLSGTAAGGVFRDRLLERLEEQGIATRQGTHAVHTLHYYQERFGMTPEALPNAYACDRLSIALPFYLQMTAEDQACVADTLRATIDEIRGDA